MSLAELKKRVNELEEENAKLRECNAGLMEQVAMLESCAKARQEQDKEELKLARWRKCEEDVLKATVETTHETNRQLRMRISELEAELSDVTAESERRWDRLRQKFQGSGPQGMPALQGLISGLQDAKAERTTPALEGLLKEVKKAKAKTEQSAKASEKGAQCLQSLGLVATEGRGSILRKKLKRLQSSQGNDDGVDADEDQSGAGLMTSTRTEVSKSADSYSREFKEMAWRVYQGHHELHREVARGLKQLLLTLEDEYQLPHGSNVDLNTMGCPSYESWSRCGYGTLESAILGVTERVRVDFAQVVRAARWLYDERSKRLEAMELELAQLHQRIAQVDDSKHLRAPTPPRSPDGATVRTWSFSHALGLCTSRTSPPEVHEVNPPN